MKERAINNRSKNIIISFFYLIGLMAFSLWLYQANQKYQSWETSTKISYKHGDIGDKMVRFPSVSICQMGAFDSANSTLWKNVSPCKEFKDDPPYFLKYLEDCLESDINMNLTELIQAVSFEPTDFILEVDTFPFENSPLGHGIRGDDLNKENPIISYQYHHHYGHCITIDISNLSKNDGRYHTKIGSHKLALHMLLKPIIGHARPLTGNFIFIHNGSNINQFGEKIQDRFIHSGLHYHVRFRAKSFFTVLENHFLLFSLISVAF